MDIKKLHLSISVDLGNEKRVSYDGDSIQKAMEALDHPVGKIQEFSVSLLSQNKSGETRSFSGRGVYAEPERLRDLLADAQAWLEEHE